MKALIFVLVALLGAAPSVRAQGGRGRGPIQIMTLSSPAWQDGATIPLKHTQPGGDVSPPLAWTNVPDNVVSYVLVVHDLDAPVSGGADDLLVGDRPELADHAEVVGRLERQLGIVREPTQAAPLVFWVCFMVLGLLIWWFASAFQHR